MQVATKSNFTQRNPPPRLVDLHPHLFRVQPNRETLYDRIPPCKDQNAIFMNAMRLSRRNFVAGAWSVANGEALFVSFYDPKAVVTLELTILCGWWAELGLPSMAIMTDNDLRGLAAYVLQGVSLQLPEPDQKGRVDMAKALLHFDPGPPPPRFEFNRVRTNPQTVGRQSEEQGYPSNNARSVVWKGLRQFGRRPVLLAVARDEPSTMIVRGWDSSMAWRMTNVVTFHEMDWKRWTQQRGRRLKRTLSAALGVKVAAENIPCADASTGHDMTEPVGDDAPHGKSSARGSLAPNQDPSSLKFSITNHANIGHLCQTIADQVEIRREGTGGIALRAPRRAGVSGRETTTGPVDDEVEGGEDSGVGSELPYGGRGGRRERAGMLSDLGGSIGDYENGQVAIDVHDFLSHEDMVRRVKDLESKKQQPPLLQDEGGVESPRRPLEEPDGSLQYVEKNRSMVTGKKVEQQGKDVKQQKEIGTIMREKWKWLGRVLCRLLRMSDYWYNFATDQTLSDGENAVRRISVLREMLQVRMSNGGFATVRSLVRVFAERYPRSIWTTFRQLMRQPKAQRCRRDMSVCAILLSDIDNPFFRHTTAGWPLARLVDLVTDAYLVESPPLSVIYEEGETTPWVTGNVIRHPATDVSGVDCTGLGTSHTIRVGGASGGGRHGTGNRAGTDGAGVTVGKTRYEKKWTTGAYVILRGSVNLYIFERCAPLPSSNSVSLRRWWPTKGRGYHHGESGSALPGVPPNASTATSASDTPRVEIPCHSSHYATFQCHLPPRIRSRGTTAGQPTMASQEYLATRALRGQPMHKLCPPADREAPALTAVMSQDSKRFTRGGNHEDGRGSHGDIYEQFDPICSSSGVGPPRGRTRTFARRWRACRLGPGALFGDRPQCAAGGDLIDACRSHPGDVSQPYITSACHAGSTGPDLDAGLLRCSPAQETAVTAETTELLEIGLEAYREMLAVGMGERTKDDVAVLRATRALDGIPTPALERICRYATDRIVGTTSTSCKHSSILKPGIEARNDLVQHDSGQRVVCWKGTFQTTSFFIAEGVGEVVLSDPPSSPSGGSVDSFFRGGRRRKKRRWRQRLDSVGKCEGGSSEKRGKTFFIFPTVHAARSTVSTNPQTSGADDSARSAFEETGSPVATISRSVSLSRLGHGDWGSGNGDECWLGAEKEKPKALAAILERGDFFGVYPTPTSRSEQWQTCSSSNATIRGNDKGLVQDTSGRLSVRENASTSPSLKSTAMEAAGVDTGVLPAAKPSRPKRFRWLPVEATMDPPILAAALPFELPSQEFPALHKASLLAGQGGVRCLAVRLTVLQNIFPSVHRRLAAAATERYSEWVGEAVRRDEELWNDRLLRGSVPSLSRSFYRSFAKADYSGNHATPVSNDLASSIAGSTNDKGESFCNGSEESIETETTVSALFPIPPSRPFSSKKRSIFDLSQRFRRLVSCSTARGVIPVRLGRALSHPRNRNQFKAVPPSGVDDHRQTDSIRESRLRPRASDVFVSATNNTESLGSAAKRGSGDGIDNSAFDTACAEGGNKRTFLKGPSIPTTPALACDTQSGTHPSAEGWEISNRSKDDCCASEITTGGARWSLEDRAQYINMDGVGSVSPLMERRRDPWDCPVSPFSPRPRWTRVKFPAGIRSASIQEESCRFSHLRCLLLTPTITQSDLGGASVSSENLLLLPSLSPSIPDSVTRPVEVPKTLASRRRKGSQWSWKKSWKGKGRVPGPSASLKGKETQMSAGLQQSS